MTELIITIIHRLMRQCKYVEEIVFVLFCCQIICLFVPSQGSARVTERNKNDQHYERNKNNDNYASQTTIICFCIEPEHQDWAY